MIPYVRNLIEYTKGDEDTDYLKLTSCLHIKSDTYNITEEDVINVIKQYTHGKPMRRVSSSEKIRDTIMNTADAIAAEENPNPVLIQNKIALSIAIRLLAEQYLHDKLIESGKTEEELSVSGTQTGKWTGMYKMALPNDEHKSIIEKVNMMTPELIHVNSFMFEPIIDMSISHLISLYKQCRDELS